MTSTDLESLESMGFEKPRAELALKHSGGRKFSALPTLLCDIS